MKKHTRIFCGLLTALAAVALLFACSTGSGGGDDGPTSTTPPVITVTPTGATGPEAVTASVSEATEGTTITLTAILDDDRRVVLSAAGVTITPSTISTSGDTATFTMPGKAVMITATFSYTPVHSMGYVTTHTANTKSFNLHYVPSGGTFIMEEDVRDPTQTVNLTKNFWMGETEVTQGLWEAVWGTIWPGREPSSTYGDGDNKPAYYVDWYEAVAFCNVLTVADLSITNTEQVYYSDATLTTAYTKASAASSATVYVDWSKKGYRLPTEAEWEYAARYIDGTNWNGGDHVSGDTSADISTSTVIGDYAWYVGNNSGNGGDPTYGSKDVGQKTANALGLRDMSGNVWEWCYDWWEEDYSGGSETDPTGPTRGSDRVYRGGDWDNLTRTLRCCNRSYGLPKGLNYSVGFRLCRTAD